MRNPPTPPSSTPAGARRGRKRSDAQGSAQKSRAAVAGKKRATGNRELGDLRTFTISFFTLFGATVTLLNTDTHGPVQLHMSGEMAEHFGAESMDLAFQSVEPGSGQQLVAHGSRVFDRMMVWLERRSALTVRRLPARLQGNEGLIDAVKPLNAGVANLKVTEQVAPLFVFHWRLTYRADDKREELFAVVLDENGRVLETGAMPDGLPNLQQILSASEPAPVFAPPPLRRRKVASGDGAPPNDSDEGGETAGADSAGNGDEGDAGDSNGGETEGAVQLEAALPATLPAIHPDDAPADSPNGQRLPAMTQLVRHAERARRYAISHADHRCVEHEAEILPRLYKSVERLINYYNQQIDELRGDSTEKAETLRTDLARKVAEEVENHRLRVLVDLTGYAVIYRPLTVVDLTLSDGVREVALQTTLDRFTGEMTRPTCHSCGDPIHGAVLCRNGHAACESCLRQCGACHEVLCAACGVSPCATCGLILCSGCAHLCSACGEAACAEHICRCPVCGDEVCDNCRAPCAECGTRQCRSHMRADSVPLAEDKGVPRLICSRCAVRCPACRQYSARLKTCEVSGQRFCANCVVACSRCGRTVGPGFYKSDSNGVHFCRDCATLCPLCGEIRSAAAVRHCATCGGECCAACVRTCVVCKKQFCRDHSSRVSECGHEFCDAHGAACAIGDEVVCPQCGEPCAICGRFKCTQHTATCQWCGEPYCTDCVDLAVDLCATCLGAATDGVEVNLAQESLTLSGKTILVALFMRWQKASNKRVTVYVGRNPFMATVIVAKIVPDGSWQVRARDIRVGALDRLRRQN